VNNFKLHIMNKFGGINKTEREKQNLYLRHLFTEKDIH